MSRKAMTAAMVVVLMGWGPSAQAQAQEPPTQEKPQTHLSLDVFAGGAYFSQAATETEPAKDLKWGWEVGTTLSYGLRWLGITAAFGSQNVAENVSGSHLAAGPRVTSPWYMGTDGGVRFFAHALGGFVRTSGAVPSRASAEWVVGAGLDLLLLRLQFDHVWLTVNGVRAATDRVFVGGVLPMCFRACPESDP